MTFAEHGDEAQLWAAGTQFDKSPIEQCLDKALSIIDVDDFRHARSAIVDG